jgi:hypothetical protein
MTPREIRLRSEGWQREQERQAQLVIWQVQHHYKSRLRPKHILHGYPKPPEK